MPIQTDLKNLNDAWLVVKKYNGKLYFKTNWSYDSKNPNSAQIFWKKEDAEKRMLQANTDRKKCRYYLEPASMHFVNDFEAGLHYWGNNPFIKNKPLALKDLEKGTEKFQKMTKQYFVEKITSEIDAKVKEKTDRLASTLKEHEKELLALKSMKEELLNFDIEKVIETYGTKAETTAQILYGTK